MSIAVNRGEDWRLIYFIFVTFVYFNLRFTSEWNLVAPLCYPRDLCILWMHNSILIVFLISRISFSSSRNWPQSVTWRQSSLLYTYVIWYLVSSLLSPLLQNFGKKFFIFFPKSILYIYPKIRLNTKFQTKIPRHF